MRPSTRSTRIKMAVNVCWFIASLTLMVAIEFSRATAVCEDVIGNCDEYAEDVCGKYPVWAKTNCAKRCNACPEGCHEEWSLYDADKTCIKVFGSKNPSEHLSWCSAKDSCEKKGGNLVIIRDKQKNDFVFGLLGDYFSHWIGMKNVAETEKLFNFQYVDGSPMGKFHPWLPENPDNTGGKEKCVTIYKKKGYDGQWNDYTCNVRLPYVCSQSLK